MPRIVNRDINERIKSICDVIFESNVTRMAKATFISRTTILSIIGDQQSSPGYDILRKLIEMHSPQINIDWLMTGRGNMIVDGEEEPPVELVPDLPVNAAAGFSSDLQDGVTPSMCNMRQRIPGLPKYDLTISVRGDSMDPTFASGDRLAIRRCYDIVEWGAPHVLDTTEGVYVKRIKEDAQSIICISDNADYPQFNIPKTCIRGIYKVVAVLRVR